MRWCWGWQELGGRSEYPQLDHEPAAADRKFREKLLADFERVGRVLLTNWPTFHDDLTLWRRRYKSMPKLSKGVSRWTRCHGATDTVPHSVPLNKPCQSRLRAFNGTVLTDTDWCIEKLSR